MDYDAVLTLNASFEFNGFSEPMSLALTVPYLFEWAPQRDGSGPSGTFGTGNFSTVLHYELPELSTYERTDKLLLQGTYTEQNFDFGAPFDIVASLTQLAPSIDAAVVRGVYLGGGTGTPSLAVTAVHSTATLTYQYVTAVPEPASAAMATAGLAVLALATRRRLRAQR